MSDLAGKRALVLGGETPLGRALAVALAEAGAEVVIASLTQETEAEFAVNSALNELWALGHSGLALVIDAADAQQLSEATARAEQELGRIDIAAVAAPDGATVAVDALRATLHGREVVVLAPGTTVEEAVALVSERL